MCCCAACILNKLMKQWELNIHQAAWKYFTCTKTDQIHHEMIPHYRDAKKSISIWRSDSLISLTAQGVEQLLHHERQEQQPEFSTHTVSAAQYSFNLYSLWCYHLFNRYIVIYHAVLLKTIYGHLIYHGKCSRIITLQFPWYDLCPKAA